MDGTLHGKERWKGILLVLFSATLWGVSGTVAQYLFGHEFTPEWLVVIRLLISGILLLSFSSIKNGSLIFTVFKTKYDTLSIIFFGVIGMLGVQYTYFAAIEASNAATATLLQYLGPVVLTLYIVLRYKQMPKPAQMVAIVLSVIGTLLLVTSGSFESLSISGQALFWGIASAFAVAFYTQQPHRLIHTFGSLSVVGWGMVIGGAGFSVVHQPWQVAGDWSITTLMAVLFVIIFGTLIPFYCYLESLNYIEPSETSILGCAEPLSAAILSVLWLHVKFNMAEWLGALFIILTIILLSRRSTKSKRKNNGDERGA